MRSWIVVDILHAHGLCLRYEKILRVTQGLSEDILKLFEHEEVIILGNLHIGLFTNGAKDNMEQVCHYFSLLLQWTLDKRDIMRNMLKFHQQTVERWENYLPFICILLKYFLPDSTVNIADKKANSTILTDERKKEFDWLKHVASLSEFVRDTSWSVHNARRNKADIVPYFNFLPLLRENVADFGKRCIEIANLAATFLNPGQTIVDTRDQPVYAIWKRL